MSGAYAFTVLTFLRLVVVLSFDMFVSTSQFFC